MKNINVIVLSTMTLVLFVIQPIYCLFHKQMKITTSISYKVLNAIFVFPDFCQLQNTIKTNFGLWCSLIAHLAKGNVSFCHHLASVIRRTLTFHILIFSSETAKPIDLKSGRKHLWKVLYKDANFVPIH